MISEELNPLMGYASYRWSLTLMFLLMAFEDGRHDGVPDPWRRYCLAVRSRGVDVIM
jgi:hypothetical protein